MNTTENPKFRRLCRELGIARVLTVGHLELFWHFAYDHAPEGNVGKWTDEDIEAASEWEGESGAFVAALLRTGFVDVSERHRLVIHDWQDHAPEFLRQRWRRGHMAWAAGTGPGPLKSDKHPDATDQGRDLSGQCHDMSSREEQSSEAKGGPAETKSRGGPPHEGGRPEGGGFNSQAKFEEARAKVRAAKTENALRAASKGGHASPQAITNGAARERPERTE